MIMIKNFDKWLLNESTTDEHNIKKANYVVKEAIPAGETEHERRMAKNHGGFIKNSTLGKLAIVTIAKTMSNMKNNNRVEVIDRNGRTRDGWIVYLTDKEIGMFLTPATNTYKQSRKFGLSESEFRQHKLYYIGTFEFKVYPEEVVVSQRSRRSKHLELFKIFGDDSKFIALGTMQDRVGNFVHGYMTEKEAVANLLPLLDTATYGKQFDAIINDPIFNRWWKKVSSEYRGIVSGRKFGLSESVIASNSTDTSPSTVEPTHYLIKDIPYVSSGNTQYKAGLVGTVEPSFGKKSSQPPGHEIHKYDNVIKLKDPESTEYMKRTWQFYMTDDDVKKYLRPLTDAMKKSKKFGL